MKPSDLIVDEEKMMKGQDILDLVISNGINLELHSEIRDQDYIIKMC